MAAVRRADAVWNGPLSEGRGIVSASTSGAFSELPVTWGSRTEEPDGRTSPEELIAAAHAACFSMAFSGDLGRAGVTPESVETKATLTMEKVNEKMTITGIHLDTVVRAPGADEKLVMQAAEAAKKGCPISRLLSNVEITLSAKLA